MISSTIDLTPQQGVAREKLSRLKVGALFMKQGTGKTRVAVELVAHNTERVDEVLCVTPFSSADDVSDELERWGCPRPYRMLGYESLSASDRVFLELLEWAGDRRVFLIADESIFLKNDHTKRYRRLLQIRKACPYAIILNGTPTTRDVWDLKRQMDFLDPRIVGMDDGEFRSRYFTRVDYKRKWESAHTFWTVYEPNVEHLMSLISPYVYVCDLELDVEVSERRRTVEVADETAEAYRHRREASLASTMLTDGTGIKQLLRDLARIAACDPDKGAAIARAVERHRAVVFCNFHRELEEIASHLSECFIITGRVSKTDRRAIRAAWTQSDLPLLITYGTGAYSLNLQGATSEAHFASPTFDYARYDQAMRRIFRMGQTSDISFTHWRTSLKIDDFIDSNVYKKGWLEKLVRRHIRIEEVV